VDFAQFVAATGYVTEAESFGFSAVFRLAFTSVPAWCLLQWTEVRKIGQPISVRHAVASWVSRGPTR
jgi:hypothetical protein